MKISLPYSIIFQDDKIIVVNKSSGISIGGDRWDESKERLDRIITEDLKISKLFTVHRIDKETSGLVIFAKNKEMHRSLSVAFEQRKIQKRYTAIIHGRPSWKETECDLPLVPNGNKKHMTIIDKYRGKESLTLFTCLFSAGNFSVIEARPQTGRIHQIRVHIASLGHPVVCDSLYGNANPIKLSSFKRGYRGDPHEERPLLSRLGLHALELSLPKDNDNYQILTAPLAKDMASLINQLEKLIQMLRAICG
ncbi:MAG: RNA pseudouridine synthase [Treponema sp.]|nr:RNA pseudouridine synthase [Treponema sp.]MCL2250948.1 RNA pseudouridine synthase [Treponema sp.]